VNGNRTRALQWLAAAAFIVLGAVIWQSAREPSFEGKKASEWLSQAGQPGTQEAAAAFRGMGKPGISFLVDCVTEDRRQRRRSWFGWLAESGLPLPDGLRAAFAPRRRVDRGASALRVFQALGPDAGAALPALMRRFNDDAGASLITRDFDVAAALEALGDAKADYLPDFLHDLQAVRWEPDAAETITLIGSIGPKAASAVPVLLRKLPGGDEVISNSVAHAIWKIDRQTNLVLQILTGQLRAPRGTFQTREAPLEYLGEMGPAAQPALPLIEQQLTNRDEHMRSAAAIALSKIDSGHYREVVREMNQNVPAKVEQLARDIRGSARERLRALEVIGMYGPDAAPAVPALIYVLQMAPPPNSFPGLGADMAANALAEIGPAAQPAVPALVTLLPATRRMDIQTASLCRALGSIGPGAAAAVPTLKEMMKTGKSVQRIAAAAALARIAPEEKSELGPILRELASHPDVKAHPRFGWPAKVALWRLGLEKEAPVKEIMDDNESLSLLSAIPLLGDIGPSAKAALPMLEKMAESEQEGFMFRRMAATGLKKIDPQEAAKLDLPGILALP
jgi:HEAT repeat protein